MHDRVSLPPLLTYLILSLAFTSILSAPTSALACGEVVTSIAAMDSDLQCPGGGIVVANGALSCFNHTIRGDGIGIGLHLTGEGATVKNCVISGFEAGLVLNHTRGAAISGLDVEGNTVGVHAIHDLDTRLAAVIARGNTIGAFLDESSIDPLSMTFVSNEKNLEYLPRRTRPSAAQESAALPSPPPALTREDVERAFREIRSTETISAPVLSPPAEALNQAGVTIEESRRGSAAVTATKTATLRRSTTDVTIDLQATSSVSGLEVIEYLPKSIVEGSQNILSSRPRFRVLHEDLVIAFNVPGLEKGQNATVTYTIDHRIARDLTMGPFTIIRIVERIDPPLATAVSILSILFAAALAAYHYLAHKLKRPTPLGTYTALYISALALATSLGWIQTTLQLPAKPTAGALLAVLVGAIGYTAWNTSSLFTHHPPSGATRRKH